MATKKKNSDVQTLDAVDDGTMNDVDEIEGTDTGDNGGNTDGNDENTENTEAPQNPDEVSSDDGNDGENDGDDTTIIPMGDGDDDGDANPLDGDDGDGDEDDDTDYAENFKLRGTELSYPVRDVKAQDRIKELEAEVAELKSDLTELKSDLTQLKSDLTELKSDLTELKSDLTELKSDLTEYVEYTQLASGIAINAGSYADLRYDVPAKSGYEFAGIGGCYLSGTMASQTGALSVGIYSSGVARFILRNFASSGTSNLDLYATLLYRRIE